MFKCSKHQHHRSGINSIEPIAKLKIRWQLILLRHIINYDQISILIRYKAI